MGDRLPRGELTPPRSDVVVVIATVIIRAGVARLALAQIVGVGEGDTTVVAVLVAAEAAV
jgi:hypothetical protein